MNHGLRILTIVPMLALFACSGSDPFTPADTPAELSTDRSTYASGDVVTLTLRNTDPFRTLQFNWCVMALQRREADEWDFMHGDLSAWEASGSIEGFAFSCFGSLGQLLRAGQSVEISSSVLGYLLTEPGPGEYRVVQGVWLSDGRRALVFSNPVRMLE